MNLSEVKKAYLIGIKGAGMTAIAEILKNRGIEVSGSDGWEKFFTDEILEKNKISFKENFSPGNIPQDADLIIYSTSYSEDNNPEMAEAKKRDIPFLSYPEVLGKLFQEKIGIAVCGTHGKTTTTAMLAECLKQSGVDPSAIVGSRVIGWEGSSLAGKGKYFVAEADEYQDKLRHYNPFGAILTSVDWDHPDYFPTFEEYKNVFKKFVAKIPKHGFLVAWGDSSSVLKIAENAKCEVIKYGFLEDNDVVIKMQNVKIKNQNDNEKFKIYPSSTFLSGGRRRHERTGEGRCQEFNIMYSGKDLGNFQIQLIGEHNILNAAAVVAVCHKLNLDMEKARTALRNFKGTSRRFEYVGERKGAILIDDYAHHPEEIKATLKAARELYPAKKIWAVFHPHTFSRTKALLSEFSQSFDDADKVIVIDIYGSVREIQGGVSSKDLTELINKYVSGKAEHIPTIEEVIKFLKGAISENDVIISMGAGDVWRVTTGLKE